MDIKKFIKETNNFEHFNWPMIIPDGFKIIKNEPTEKNYIIIAGKVGTCRLTKTAQLISNNIINILGNKNILTLKEDNDLFSAFRYINEPLCFGSLFAVTKLPNDIIKDMEDKVVAAIINNPSADELHKFSTIYDEFKSKFDVPVFITVQLPRVTNEDFSYNVHDVDIDKIIDEIPSVVLKTE